MDTVGNESKDIRLELLNIKGALDNLKLQNQSISKGIKKIEIVEKMG